MNDNKVEHYGGANSTEWNNRLISVGEGVRVLKLIKMQIIMENIEQEEKRQHTAITKS